MNTRLSPPLWAKILFGIVALATFVALFYAEEDWRGRRDWESYKQRQIAAGEKFDLAAYALPPIPDDQNFYKTPLFLSIGYGRGRVNDVGQSFDAKNFWSAATASNTINLKAAQDALRKLTNYFSPSAGQSPAEDIVNALQLIPEYGELRKAALRPLAQCDPMTNATHEVIPNFIILRNMFQLLSVACTAHLELGQSDEGVGDLQVYERLVDSLRGNQTLVSAMIRVAGTGLMAQTFWQGWSNSKWSAAQLESLEGYFASVNLIDGVDRSFHAGPHFTQENLLAKSNKDLLEEFKHFNLPTRSLIWLLNYAPRGWLYQNILFHDQFTQSLLTGLCDPTNQLVDPEKCESAKDEIDSLHLNRSFSSLLAGIATPNYEAALRSTAKTQACVNEAAIVCALERFRFAEGHYPEALAELPPKFIGKLPVDPVNGEPFHYKRNGEQFSLYSVGWNLKDDGGEPSPDPTGPDDEGDWVWRSRP